MEPFTTFMEMAYPTSFSFSQFENIHTYAGKIKYATEHLQRISSGSSRVIFKIDDEKVLKVAKNIKGLGQNYTEMDAMKQQWYGDILAKIFKVGDTIKDEGPFYLEMELAKKISHKRFQQLLGFSINDLNAYLSHMAFLHKKRRYDTAANIEGMESNEFVQSLWDMIQNFDMTYPGDFGVISTYGEVIRDGKPTVVLIDFGLSNQVWLDYYAKN